MTRHDGYDIFSSDSHRFKQRTQAKTSVSSLAIAQDVPVPGGTWVIGICKQGKLPTIGVRKPQFWESHGPGHVHLSPLHRVLPAST